MPPEEKKCVFDVGPDHISLLTMANGDRVNIKGIHMGQDEAAALAWMVNSPGGPDLEVTIKIKGN